MSMPEYQSDFARKYVAQGLAQGHREGLCSAIRRVIEKRGLGITVDQVKELEACADIALLETWLDRALIAKDANEVFASA